MPAPTYPGPVVDGEIATAGSVNELTEVLFLTLDPVQGWGLDNENINDDEIVHTKFLGNLLTRNDAAEQTLSHPTTWSGRFSHNDEISFPFEDTTPIVSEGNFFNVDNSASGPVISVTDFDDGAAGQMLYMYSQENVYAEQKTKLVQGTGDGPIECKAAANNRLDGDTATEFVRMLNKDGGLAWFETRSSEGGVP